MKKKDTRTMGVPPNTTPLLTNNHSGYALKSEIPEDFKLISQSQITKLINTLRDSCRGAIETKISDNTLLRNHIKLLLNCEDKHIPALTDDKLIMKYAAQFKSMDGLISSDIRFTDLKK